MNRSFNSRVRRQLRAFNRLSRSSKADSQMLVERRSEGRPERSVGNHKRSLWPSLSTAMLDQLHMVSRIVFLHNFKP